MKRTPYRKIELTTEQLAAELEQFIREAGLLEGQTTANVIVSDMVRKALMFERASWLETYTQQGEPLAKERA